MPGASVIGPLRIVKDDAEIEALGRAAHAVDVVAAEMRLRPFRGRTELDVHRELVERMLAEGHERANFAIVAAGEHAASPHHEPSADRVIGDGDIVLCDFGGTMQRYCSDITRMFHVGEPTTEVRDAYTVLAAAQEAGVRAATVGTPCEAVDAAARDVIARRRIRRATSSIASATASGATRTRIRTWSPATHCRSRQGTRSASSPASTCPGGSACGSRTSSSRLPTARSA